MGNYLLRIHLPIKTEREREKKKLYGTNNAPHQVEGECEAERLDLVRNTIIDRMAQYYIVAAIECEPL